MKEKKERQKNLKRNYIIWGVVVLVLAAITARFILSPKSNLTGSRLVEYSAEKRDIVIDITESSIAEPLEKYNINATVTGKVTTINSDVGQLVKKGEVIFSIDKAEAQAALTRSQNALTKFDLGQTITTENIQGLTIYAPVDGYVDNIIAIKGMQITAGMKVADICRKDEVDTEGVITEVYVPEVAVTSTVSGKIKNVFVENKELVKKGTKILEIENSAYTTQKNQGTIDRRDLVEAITSARRKLAEYDVKAPIDGVVIKKNISVGEVSGMSPAQPQFVIGNLSKMKTVLMVDEMDISGLKEGMKANISVDSIKNKTFEGVISKIAIEGISGNGVTSYPVEVTIDKAEGIKISMNLDVNIIVEKTENVLTVPIDAVTKADNKTYVYVKEDELVDINKMEFKDPSKSFTTNGVINSFTIDEIKGYVKKEVKTGKFNSEYIEITKGLKEGDKFVVIETSESWYPGMMMRGDDRINSISDIKQPDDVEVEKK